LIKKVLLTDAQLKTIQEDRDRYASKGLETGGWLFGKVHPNDLAVISRVLDAGLHAERTPISFSGDNEYAASVKTALQNEDPDIRLLGEYHVHPWNGNAGLSGGDVRQLSELKELRPWFIVLLSTKTDMGFFDLDNEVDDEVNVSTPTLINEIKDIALSETVRTDRWGSGTRVVPHQLVKSDAADKEQVLDRILQTTNNDLLVRKTVLIAGLGSGGSTIAKYLGCTGIGRIILVDNEALEIPNIIRHEGGLDDIGRPKADICREMIESHNPFTVVEAHHFDLIEDTGRLQKLFREADLIIGSSGSPKVNHILNKLSVERGIPAVYGGVYEKASGGYVLAVKPRETACFNCLFNLTSQSYSVDKEAAGRYGLDENELHRQQGLWIDISFPSLMLSKMALALLEGRELGCSLATYDANMEIRKLPAAKREDCAVCSEEEWTKRQELPAMKRAYTSFWEKVRSLITRA